MTKETPVHVLPEQPSAKGPADWFTGDVHFTPCARTAWHRHAVGQTLHVTEGVGLVQSRGGEVIEIKPGDTIYNPAGERHWHGAAPDHFMTHLAMWEGPAPDSGLPETEWGDFVTDEEYKRG
jgi:quercetin dioxygenase-like cupin family protein